MVGKSEYPGDQDYGARKGADLNDLPNYADNALRDMNRSSPNIMKATRKKIVSAQVSNQDQGNEIISYSAISENDNKKQR